VYILYSLLLTAGFVLALPWFLWKGRATGKYLRTFRERMGRLPVYLNVDGDRSVWITRYPSARSWPPGPRAGAAGALPGPPPLPLHDHDDRNAVAKKSVRGVDGLFYAPFDFPHPVRRALEVLNPSLLVLVETELWPNLVTRRGGAAPGSPRQRPHLAALVPPLRARAAALAPVLSEVDRFLMQGEAHAERIRALGAPATACR